MGSSIQEKYIGDKITDDGKNTTNIAARKAKGFGIAGDILAILDEIPFGKYRVEAGIHMRNGMLVNGMLTNSEVWYGVTNDELKHLEMVDEYLIRKILNCHSKTSIELIYLETGIIPIRYLLKARRISYLRTLLNRDTSELTSRVYFAQKRRPIKDDWVLSVHDDLKELEFTEDDIKILKNYKFKKYLKTNLRKAAFRYLQNLRLSHSKGSQIIYNNLELQNYLKSRELSMKEKSLLFKLRTQMTDVRANFSSKYVTTNCNLCDTEVPQTEWHLLQCPILIESCTKLKNDSQTEYEDIFDDIDSQVQAVKLFEDILKIKEKIEEKSS